MRWTAANTKSEITHAFARSIAHPPTVAYHLRNAVLFDGSIYARHHRAPIAEKDLFKTAARTQQITSCALTSSYLGTKFFGHWLLDDCATYVLAESIAPPLCVRGAAFPHASKYASWFDQTWNTVDRAHIGWLTVFQDFALNSHKRKRLAKLRNIIRGRFAPNNPDKDKYVYLRRGQTGALRLIANEDLLINSLAKRGFSIVDIETTDLDDLLRTLACAKLTVSMEGSHCAHCVLAMPENSLMLILQPSDLFSASGHALTAAVNLRSGFIVGPKTPFGYSFTIDEILRTADLGSGIAI